MKQENSKPLSVKIKSADEPVLEGSEPASRLQSLLHETRNNRAQAYRSEMRRMGKPLEQEKQ